MSWFSGFILVFYTCLTFWNIMWLDVLFLCEPTQPVVIHVLFRYYMHIFSISLFILRIRRHLLHVKLIKNVYTSLNVGWYYTVSILLLHIYVWLVILIWGLIRSITSNRWTTVLISLCRNCVKLYSRITRVGQRGMVGGEPILYLLADIWNYLFEFYC